MFDEVVGLDVELLGELLDRDAFAQRDLAGGTLELEHLRRDRRGLLAGVAARRRSLLLRLVLALLGHDDVRTEIVGDDLRSGERPFREQLVVDFDRALALAALSGGLLLFGTLVAAVGGLLPADDRRAGHRRRRRHGAHRTSRTSGTQPRAGTHARAGRPRARRSARTPATRPGGRRPARSPRTSAHRRAGARCTRSSRTRAAAGLHRGGTGGRRAGVVGTSL